MTTVDQLKRDKARFLALQAALKEKGFVLKAMPLPESDQLAFLVFRPVGRKFKTLDAVEALLQKIEGSHADS